MSDSFKRNPALWVSGAQAIVSAGLALAVGFGLAITPAQIGLVAAFLAAVGGFVIRANVYAPVDKDGNPIEVVPSK
jgi:uncharacterized protein (DUF2062 family)